MAHDTPLVGSVALADRRTAGSWLIALPGQDRQGEFVECRGEPSRRCRVGSEFVVTTSQILNERVPPDHDTRGPVCLQPAHRPQTCLQPGVITLAPVVGVTVRNVSPDPNQQQTFRLALCFSGLSFG